MTDESILNHDLILGHLVEIVGFFEEATTYMINLKLFPAGGE